MLYAGCYTHWYRQLGTK